MTKDTRPRRFFGLLCAHHWEHWGVMKQQYVSGRLIEHIVLQCRHCGDVKYPKKEYK
jgi:hypothetical protein